MKTFNITYLIIVLLSSSLLLHGQTVWSEDFSTNANNDIIGNDNNLPVGSDWSRSVPSNGYAKINGNQFKIKDLDSEVTFTTETIDISSYSTYGVDISIDIIGDKDMDNGLDWIRFYSNIDGAGETLFTTNGDNNGKTSLTGSVYGLTGSNLVITVKFRCDHKKETPKIDNIIVTDAAPLIAQNKAASGYALDFTGDTDGYVDIPNPADMEFGSSQDFTIEFWGAVDQSNSWETFIGDKDWDSYTTDGWIFSTYTTDLMGFNIADGSDQVNLFSTINLETDETWHHYAVSVDRDGSAIMYVDGILTDSESLSAIGNIDNALDINIGRGSTNSYDGEIKIDEIRVWDDVRSQTEIRDNMCSKLIGDESNLIHYWRIDEGDGGTSTTIPDVTGTATGTLYNLTPASDWIWSGASLGDASIFEATVTTSTSDLNIAHANGDDLNIEFTSGTAASFCVYRVDEPPIPNTSPGTQISISTTNYYGARGFNTSGFDYNATYNYDGHPGITDEDVLELSSKTNNEVQTWTQESATLNTIANTLILTGESANEYILGFVPGSDIYSITSDDWDQTTTWSYTSGGLTCSCLPDASSQVHIESGFTVTMDSNADAKDVTVYSGGVLDFSGGNKTLNINNGGTLDVQTGGSFTTSSSIKHLVFKTYAGTYAFIVGSGVTVEIGDISIESDLTLDITGAGSINCRTEFDFIGDNATVNNSISGVLAIGSAGTSNLQANAGFTGNTFENNGICTISDDIYFEGEGNTFQNDGVLTVENDIYFDAANNETFVNTGTTTCTSGGFRCDNSIQSGILYTNTGTLNSSLFSMADATFTFNNTGSVNLTSNFVGCGNVSHSINNLNGGVWNWSYTGGAADADIRLFCNFNENTFNYNGGGNQIIIQPQDNYWHLSAATSGTKSTSYSPVDIAGDFIINGTAIVDAGTGSDDLLIAGNWTNSTSGGFISGLQTVTFNSGITQTISNTSGAESLYNIIISSAGTKLQMNCDINISGDLTINDNTDLDAATNIKDISIMGNWINNETTAYDGFIEGWGTVIFNGNSAQSITHGNAESFYNLIISNPIAELTLNAPTDVSGLLTFLNGNMVTTSINLLTLNDDATTSSGSDNSFVDGPMKKIGNDAFDFPVGDAGLWRRIGITAPSFTNTEYTAEYFNSVHSDATNLNTGFYNVSQIAYWDLDQGVNNDDVSVELFWEDAATEGIDDCSDITIGHYYNPGSGLKWYNQGGTFVAGSNCSGSGTGSVLTNEAVVDYSPFSFGSYSPSLNPLPIELITFNALLNGRHVDLEWATASEINNDFFTVQRSADAFSYEDIATVGGAGNSNSILVYSIIDFNPLDDISYYRLKQTDFDGNYEYSEIIYINFEHDLIANPAIPVILVSPNPVTNSSMKILLSNFDINQNIEIVLFNEAGIMCMSSNTHTDSEGNVEFLLNCEKFNPGVFFLSAKSESLYTYTRVLIEK